MDVEATVPSVFFKVLNYFENVLQICEYLLQYDGNQEKVLGAKVWCSQYVSNFLLI